MFERGEKKSADFTERQNDSSGPIYSKNLKQKILSLMFTVPVGV
jgi:hypothetical protein